MTKSLTSIERAIRFAVERHAGQRDKAGAPYILHPLRVMHAVRGDAAKIAAVLHHTIEDTGATWDELAALDLPVESLEAIRLLTHKPDDGSEAAYLSYVAQVARHPTARAVKLADLADNLDVGRLPEVSERDARRLSKYLKARKLLLDEI
jgi:guanosine-3',5'-bis(diphosphate) 3'-pyrophosphohydrolase